MGQKSTKEPRPSDTSAATNTTTATNASDTDGRKDSEGARTSIDSSFKAVEPGESAGYSSRDSSDSSSSNVSGGSGTYSNNSVTSTVKK
ncbi:hypothetical protein JX265_012843 [Neoarthrinium moseri]|uniref:Uncharacterized protein n=1 Tax=Neoarthrinium moseri TaxID=1658444 RepID=A0A9Q0AI87_9PEZI|nr:hypothetical protein JX265_012843 [Neoarthrinium moseri]